MTADDTREALTQMLSEVSFMRSCIASGERLNADDLTRQDDVMRRARAALAAARRDPEPDASADSAWLDVVKDVIEWRRVNPASQWVPNPAHQVAIEAAIRGTEARASLDVDRLRQAIDVTLPGSLTFISDIAADVVTEYARLAEADR